MIVYIIGSYCIAHAIIGEIALWASVIQNENPPEGARAKANFMIMGFLFVAAWCFK